MYTLPVQIQAAIDQIGLVDDLYNSWLRDAIADGANPDEMMEGLVMSGRPPDLAALTVALAARGLYIGGEKGIDHRATTRSRSGSPVVPHAIHHQIDTGDMLVRKILSIGHRGMVLEVYDNLITPAEMAHLKSEVANRLDRSYVVGRGFSNEVSSVRTSRGAFINRDSHPLVRSIESRIAAITGIPASFGEALQVLHYAGAEEYQPHYDFFEPQDNAERANLEASGNRVGTMLMYMSDVAEGGSTYFPKLDIAIHPKVGQGVWFGYLDADGKLDYRSEHAGLPIITGEKWLATKWLRQREVAQPPVEQWADSGQVTGAGTSPPMLPLDPASKAIGISTTPPV